MAMGLSFLAIASAMSGCNKIDGESGAGGDGGVGGDGASQHPTSTKATSTKATVTSAMYAASTYGTGFTESCDDIGACYGGGSPNLGCFECAVYGGVQYSNSGACAYEYSACKGIAGDCSDGEPECCQLEACLDGCGADPAAYWSCACGSADEASCNFATAPADSCFGDYPTGTELMYGDEGWVTCVAQVCTTSCE
jgi:hypothetical protein